MGSANLTISPSLSVREVAEALKVSDRTVRQWILDGRGGKKLAARRPGNTGDWRIEEKDLTKFMANDQADNDG